METAALRATEAPPSLKAANFATRRFEKKKMQRGHLDQLLEAKIVAKDLLIISSSATNSMVMTSQAYLGQAQIPRTPFGQELGNSRALPARGRGLLPSAPHRTAGLTQSLTLKSSCEFRSGNTETRLCPKMLFTPPAVSTIADADALLMLKLSGSF